METQSESKKSNPIYRAFIDDCGVIYEQVHDEETDGPIFIKFDKISEEVCRVPYLELGNKIYRPINNDIVSKQIVLLPTNIRDYGSVDNLLKGIQNFIHKYIDLTYYGEVLGSYYVLLSWIYDSFETIPYLKFTGDYGTGKTRALKVIGGICYKPIFAGGAITVSPIFRLIEQFHGTLIIDEADFSHSDQYADIVKILNCGYTKNMPVLRTEGDKKKEPMAFDVFCPKLVATRERFKDLALESRCFTEVMKGNPRADIPYQLPKEYYRESMELRNMLLLFRLRKYGGVEVKESLRIEGVEPRINQIVMPILALVEDDTEREKIIDFIKAYDKRMKNLRSDDIPGQILSAIISLHQESEQLTYKKIAEKLNEERTEKTGEYKISPTKIGKTNVSALNFETTRINGRTLIKWNDELVNRLCGRYGIDYPALVEKATDQSADGLDEVL